MTNKATIVHDDGGNHIVKNGACKLGNKKNSLALRFARKFCRAKRVEVARKILGAKFFTPASHLNFFDQLHCGGKNRKIRAKESFRRATSFADF